eukprot:Ihof_evm1s449 gene=Ihof_evmTU1s449
MKQTVQLKVDKVDISRLDPSVVLQEAMQAKAMRKRRKILKEALKHTPNQRMAHCLKVMKEGGVKRRSQETTENAYTL